MPSGCEMDEREIITRIKKIEAIQAARKKGDALSRYNVGEKVHEKQMAFHKSPKRNRWVFGGNRSGKTECGAVETVWMARGNHPYRENRPNVVGWVVSVTYEVQREVAQAKILRYLRPDWIVDVVMREGKKGSPDTGVIDTILVKNVFGGTSKIGFKSCDQGREKFQGASLDFVWFDEEPPQEIYEECRMRVLDKKGDIFGTMTPLKGLTWVHDAIYLNLSNDPEVFYIQMEWADNPYLDPAEVERYEKTLSKDEIDARRFGRFRTESGLVYPEFDETIHVIEPFDVPFDWQDKISIDPGLRNPLSAHFYAMNYDGTIYVVGEHYEAEREVTYHAEKIFELADKLGWHRRYDGKLDALIDSAAGQRTLASVKSVSELFFDVGIAVNPNVNKEMFAGITRVRELFAARPPKIFIFKTCVHLIRELKSYRWGNDDLPKKVDDHCLDELRYYVMSRPVPPKQNDTPQKKYYDSLYKKMRSQKKTR